MRKTIYVVHVPHLLILKTDARKNDAQGRTHARTSTDARTHAPRFSHMARRCSPMRLRSHGDGRAGVEVVAEIIRRNTHTMLVYVCKNSPINGEA